MEFPPVFSMQAMAEQQAHQISNLTCCSGSVFVKKAAPIVDSCGVRGARYRFSEIMPQRSTEAACDLHTTAE